METSHPARAIGPDISSRNAAKFRPIPLQSVEHVSIDCLKAFRLDQQFPWNGIAFAAILSVRKLAEDEIS
jgi:hypothetical protein